MMNISMCQMQLKKSWKGNSIAHFMRALQRGMQKANLMQNWRKL